MAVIVSDTSKRLDQEKKALKSLLDIKVDAIVVALKDITGVLIL